jgi:uncharacterized membrane protein
MMRGGNGLQWLWRLHRGKLVGAGVGLLIALLVMWARWWSLLIIAFVLAGGWIGTRFVDSQLDVDLVDE